jgi:hypothetical protein
MKTLTRAAIFSAVGIAASSYDRGLPPLLHDQRSALHEDEVAGAHRRIGEEVPAHGAAADSAAEFFVVAKAHQNDRITLTPFTVVSTGATRSTPPGTSMCRSIRTFALSTELADPS